MTARRQITLHGRRWYPGKSAPEPAEKRLPIETPRRTPWLRWFALVLALALLAGLLAGLGAGLGAAGFLWSALGMIGWRA